MANSTLTINTKQLKSMVSKIIKCSSNNINAPLTSLIEIKVDNNVLYLTTTDMINTAVAKYSITNEDFRAVVDSNLFFKLVSKLTSENTEITKNSSSIVIKADGKYTIPIQLTGEGDEIVFRSIEFEEGYQEINIEDIKLVEKINKQAINNKIADILNNYAFTREYVFTTDTNRVACINKNIFNRDILINETLFNLLTLFDSNFVVSFEDRFITCYNNDLIIRGQLLDSFDEYPINNVEDVIHQEAPHSCLINKGKLLSAIDRISLFSNDDTILLEFVNNSLTIRHNNATETIETTSNFNGDTSKLLNKKMLIDSIKSTKNEHIEILFGLDNFISIKDENVMHVLCLEE